MKLKICPYIGCGEEMWPKVEGQVFICSNGHETEYDYSNKFSPEELGTPNPETGLPPNEGGGEL